MSIFTSVLSTLGGISSWMLSWTKQLSQVSYIPDGEYSGIAFGNGLFIAVGEYVAVQSTDGINWVTSSIPTNKYSEIIYGNGRFIAASSSGDGKVVISTDAVNWTTSAHTAYGGIVSVIAVSGTTNILLAFDNSNDIFSSINNGTNWTASSWTVGGAIRGVMRGGVYSLGAGYYVLNGKNRYSKQFVSSNNGVNWSESPVNFNSNVATSFARGNEILLGYDKTVGSILIEKQWTRTYFDASTSSKLSLPLSLDTGIYFINGLFIGLNGDSSMLFYSADGSSWSRQQLPKGVYTSLSYGNGQIVVVGSSVACIVPVNATTTVTTSANNLPGIAMDVTYGDKYVAVGSYLTAISTDASAWVVTYSPCDFRCVTYQNSLYVAIGYGNPGTGVSTDGISWTTSTSINSADSLAYGAGVFVTVSTNSRSYSSTDGSNWTERTTPGAYGSIIYANSLFIAVGTNVAGSSTDGITWTARTIPTAQYSALAANPTGLVVAVPYNAMGQGATSADGITWTSRVFPGNVFKSVVWHPLGYFVAKTDNGHQTSTNGITWTFRDGFAQDLRMVYINGGLISLSRLYYNEGVGHTTDGISWIRKGGPSMVAFLDQTLSYISNRYIAIGNDITTSSTDGITWLNVPGSSTAMNNNRNLKKYEYINSRHVFTDGNGGFSTSTDLLTWTYATLPSSTVGEAVAYGNGVYVTVGSVQWSGSSTNGTNWTVGTLSNPTGTGKWIGVAFGAGKFLAIHNSVGFYFINESTNGINWVRADNPALTCSGITYTNSNFIITSKNERLAYTSPNGTRWFTSNISGFSKIKYSNGFYFALASGRLIGTSTDRIAWVLSPASPNTGNSVWLSAAAGDGTFVAVSTGRAAYSTDFGQTWIDVATPATTSYFEVEYGVANNGQGMFVIAGTSNSAYSTNGINWVASSGSTPGCTSMTYGSGTWVAVGGTNAWYTQFPSSWNSVSNTFTNTSRGVAFDGVNTFVTVGIDQSSRSVGGTSWTTTTGVATADSPYSDFSQIAYINGVYICFSASPRYMVRSTDGVNWSKLINVPFVVSSITYNKDKVTMLAGSPTSIITTVDGYNFICESRDSGISDPSESVVYANGKYFIVANKFLFVSTNAISWNNYYTGAVKGRTIIVGSDLLFNGRKLSLSSIPAETIGVPISDGMPRSKFNKIVYGNNRFVAVGKDCAAVSTDSVIWQTANIDLGDYIDLVYTSANGGRFLAITYDSATVSTDGIVWRQSRFSSTTLINQYPPYKDFKAAAVSSNGDRFVIVGNGIAVTSDDNTGLTFVNRTIPAGNYSCITYTNNTFVAAGTNIVAKSTNGVSWSTVSTTITSGSATSIVYGNGSILMFNGGRAWTSPDTVIWRTTAIAGNFTGIAYDVSGGFVGVGTSSLTACSTDSIIWQYNVIPTGDYYGVVYAAGKYIAIASTGAVTSTDGINWTSRAIPTTSVAYWTLRYVNGVIIAGGAHNVLTTTDGISWVRNSLPNSSIYDITYNGSIYIALGSNSSSVGISTDAVNWTNTHVGAFAATGVAYGNGVYAAIDANGTTIASTDGLSWQAGLTVTSYSFTGLVFFNGRFIATGATGTFNHAYYSTNGVIWESGLKPRYLRAFTYGNGMFVGLTDSSYNKAYRSLDGINWSETTSPVGNFYSAAYGNGIFVAVGIDIWGKSTNGVNWTTGTLATSKNFYKVVYGNGKFVTFAQSGWPYTSVDGSTWTSNSNETLYTSGGSSLVFGNGIFIQSESNKISTDGLYWASVFDGNKTNGFFTNSIVYGNNQFVAVGAGTSLCAISTDSNFWLYPQLPAGGFNSVAYGADLYVAIGNYVCATSTNGINWTSRTYPLTNTTGNQSYYIRFVGNKFVAVASGTTTGWSRIASSTDGLSWSTASPSVAPFRAVTYGNSTYVVVGSSTCVTSTDAISWTVRTGFNIAPNEIAFGAGIFVAMGNNAANYMTSTDGITWTTRTATSTNYQALVFNGSIFIASSGVSFYTSTNGISWTTRALPNGQTNAYNRLALAGTDVMSFTGDGNPNIFSTDGINWTNRGGLPAGGYTAITYDGAKFVATGPSKSSYSTNGMSWVSGGSAPAMTCLAYGNGVYVGGSRGTSSGGVSTDGINWTTVTNTGFNAVDIYYVNDRFITATDGGVGSTTNGINWDSYSNLKSAGWLGLSIANNRVFATGGSICNISVNGTSWDTTVNVGSGNFYSVAYGNNTYVMVGAANYRRSTDGINWVTPATSPGQNVYSVAFGAGKFVAVGGTGNGVVQAATSTNGDHWIAISNALPRTSSAADGTEYKSIEYFNGKFAATGLGIQAVSDDGVTWNLAGRSPSVLFSDITSGNGKFFQCGGNGPLFSTDGSAWTHSGSTFSGEIVSAAYGAGVTVAVGTGFITVSTDGFAWTQVSMPRAANTLFNHSSVVYGNGIFSVFANTSVSGSVDNLISTDGYNWTTSAPSEAYTITYGAGKYVAVSNSGQAPIVTSIDGLSWKVSITGRFYNDITYVNGIFIAVGGYSVIRSTDGNNWVETYTPISDAQGIAYGANVYVTVGNTIAASSTNGINWTNRTLSANMSKVVYATSKFVAVGTGGCYTSTDGISWTSRTMSIQGNGNFRLIYAGNQFVQVGSSSAGNSTSPDGITWTTRSNFISSSVYGITYANGYYIVAASPKTLYSTDGIIWGVSAITGINTVTYSATRGYICLGSSTIFTSPDSKLWVSRSGSGILVRSCIFANNLFVAIGGVSGAITSTDGISWTGRTIPGITEWRSITHSGTLFVAVGTTGAVAASSTDGINWTSRTIATGSYFKVIYANSLFTAVGTNVAATSTDGATWTSRTIPSATYRGLTYDSVKGYIAVGTGALAASTDSITWVSRTFYGSSVESYNGIACNSNVFVAVGTATLVYSTDGISWKPALTPKDSYTTVEYLNSKFIAMGSAYGQMHSTNGINWDHLPLTSSDFGSVNFVNGRVIALGGSLRSGISTDGVFWSCSNNQGSKFVNYIVDRFISADQSGNLWSSFDGKAWIAISNCPGGLTHVFYGNGVYVALSGNSTYFTSTDLVFWGTRTMPTPSPTWTKGIYANSMYIVIGNTNDTYVTSTDAITWTSRNFPVSNVTDVIYANDIFVATSRANQCVITSTNGINWTTRNTQSGEYMDILHTGSMFIAVPRFSPQVSSISTDAITWVSRYKDNRSEAISSSGGLIYAYGEGYQVTSTDGYLWVTSGLTNMYISDIIYDGTQYLGLAGNVLFNSSDLISWSSRTIPASATSLIYNGSQYVAIGNNAGAYSTNSINWTTINKSYSGYTGLYFVDSKYYAQLNNQLHVSTNGIDWTLNYSLKDTTGSSKVNSIASSGATFITVGDNYSLTSTDAVTWSTLSEPIKNMKSIVFANSTYVAVGTNSAATSTDGITWISRTVPFGDYFTVLYAAGKFTAFSAFEIISSANNGVTWTRGIVPYTFTRPITGAITNGADIIAYTSTVNQYLYSLNGAAWAVGASIGFFIAGYSTIGSTGANTFRMVDTSNTVFTGPANGLSTTSNNINITNCSSIAYNNSVFVAVSYNNESMFSTSTNGINWTQRSGIPTGRYRAVKYYGSLFVAVGEAVSAYSTDGISWQSGATTPDSYKDFVYNTTSLKYTAINGTNSIITGI